MNFYTIGFFLIFAGILVIIMGYIFTEGEKKIEKKHNLTTSAGGVVFIGPLPIIFGTDSRAAIYVSILGLVLMILSLILLLLSWRQF